MLNHWGRLMHMCISKLRFINGSDNGMSPGRHQAIIWTNAGILLIWILGTLVKSLIFIHFHSRKFIWKCRLRNSDNFVLASMCQSMPLMSEYVKIVPTDGHLLKGIQTLINSSCMVVYWMWCQIQWSINGQVAFIIASILCQYTDMAKHTPQAYIYELSMKGDISIALHVAWDMLC